MHDTLPICASNSSKKHLQFTFRTEVSLQIQYVENNRISPAIKVTNIQYDKIRSLDHLKSPKMAMCSMGGQTLGKSHCWPEVTKVVGSPPEHKYVLKSRRL